MFRFAVCFIFSLLLNTAHSWEHHEDISDHSSVAGIAHKIIIIDAGSSGARAMAYDFEKAVDEQVFDLKSQTPLLESNKKLPPDSKLPAEFVHFLKQHKPDSFQPKAARHFFLGATAGLRSVDSDTAKTALLNSADEISKLAYVASYNDNVRLLSGLEEGAYTWFGVNFIMQTAPVDNSASAHIKRMASWKQSQYGIIELGGGSVQVAFRIPEKLKHEGLRRDTSPDLIRAEEANVKTFYLPGDDHLEVFANSQPRKGLNSAYRDLKDRYLANPVENPCLIKNTPVIDENQNTAFAYGNYDACVEAINNTLFSPLQPSFDGKGTGNKEAIFDQVYKNLLPKRFFLTGYFFDRTVAMGLPEILTPRYLEQAAEHVCNMDYGSLLLTSAVKAVFAGFREGPLTKRKDGLLFLKERISQGGTPRETNIEEYCAHLTYMSLLLKKIGLSPDHNLYTQKSLLYRGKGFGVSWPLGYAILATNGWE